VGILIAVNVLLKLTNAQCVERLVMQVMKT